MIPLFSRTSEQLRFLYRSIWRGKNGGKKSVSTQFYVKHSVGSSWAHLVPTCFCSPQRLLQRRPGPLHPEPRLLRGQQVPAEVLENQADAPQGHREERGRARGGVGRRSRRQAGGEDQEFLEENHG